MAGNIRQQGFGRILTGAPIGNDHHGGVGGQTAVDDEILKTVVSPVWNRAARYTARCVGCKYLAPLGIALTERCIQLGVKGR